MSTTSRARVKLWTRLFDGRVGRARAAELAGDWERALDLWLEMEEFEKAREVLESALSGTSTSETHRRMLEEHAHRFPLGSPERRTLEGRWGALVLERTTTPLTNVARAGLVLARERLEATGDWARAVRASELLEDQEGLARALSRAGDVERLEEVLERSNRELHGERRLRALLRTFEEAMRLGSRQQAWADLAEAHALAPNDPSVAGLIERFKERELRGHSLRLSFSGSLHTLVFANRAVFGRTDCDVIVRGSSVSRRHAQVEVRNGALAVSDLSSRNGTLIEGVPMHEEALFSGPLELGLGESARVRIELQRCGFEARVTHGPSRGELALVGASTLDVAGIPGTFSTHAGGMRWTPPLGAEAHLAGVRIRGAIELLLADVVTVSGVSFEVLP